MLCAPFVNEEREEVVVERELAPPSVSGTEPGSSEPAPSSPRSSQGQLQQSESLIAPDSQRGKVHSATERRMMGLIITERQERLEGKKAVEEQLEHERKERVSSFEELWKKVEEVQMQQKLETGGRHRLSHARGHGGKMKGTEHEQFIHYSHQLIDFCLAQGTALRELFEALHHYSDGLFKNTPGSSLVQDDIQAFKERISCINHSWTEAHNAASRDLADELRPQELSARLVSLEKTIRDQSVLQTSGVKLDDEVQELKCQCAAMEEALHKLVFTATEAASGPPSSVSPSKQTSRSCSRASTVPGLSSVFGVESAGTLSNQLPVTSSVLEDMRKKVKALEDTQEGHGKNIKEALCWRADLVNLMMSVPLQAVQAQRNALRSPDLSPQKRQEMLKALDAKEVELKADLAMVKARYVTPGLDMSGLEELEKKQSEDVVTASKWSHVNGLTIDIEC